MMFNSVLLTTKAAAVQNVDVLLRLVRSVQHLESRLLMVRSKEQRSVNAINEVLPQTGPFQRA